MANSEEYKIRNDIEKEIFKYCADDLINILISHHETVFQTKNIPSSKLREKLEKMNFNTLSELIVNNLNINDINFELDKLETLKIPDVVKNNFPSENPRELQMETVSKIYYAIQNGYKYIILEAVSGFGKSLIASALSYIFHKEKAYLLTTTNQLADQYIKGFEKNGISRFMPRFKFKCKKSSLTCSAYLCKYLKCKHYKFSDFSKDFEKPMACSYLYYLKEALKSDTVVSTYDYFISENFYHSHYITPRKLLICDEGHNFDEKISNAVSLKITPKQFENEMKLNESEEYKYITQSEDYYYYLIKFKRTYELKMENMTEGSRKYISYKKQLDDIIKFMSYFDKSNENLAFERDKNKNWIFRPVRVNNLIKDSLLQFGEVCIFMSSSIFDYENFTYEWEVDEKEIYYIKVPNIFDLSDNPIKIYTEFDMGGEPIETGAAKDSLDTINQIIEIHSKEKGIIHTANHEQAQYLIRKIGNKHLITHNPDNREEILNEFINSKQPLVLVSPSMNEGVDLPGELCRFQILFKLPYLPYKDSWIGKRKSLYEDGDYWYKYKMITKLIQEYGRGIRFEGDYCKTYILDNRLFDVINDDLEGNEIIPKYFIDAIEDFDLT